MHNYDSAPATAPATNTDADLVVVYRPPAGLTPYGQNARTHSPDQVRQIRASIDEFGFTNPILLRDDGTNIGAGHGRWEASLLDPPLERVPTIILPGLTEGQWRAYILADNKLALNAGWDEALLVAEFDALVGMNFDLGVIGFEQAELDAIYARHDAVQTGLIPDDDAPPLPETPTAAAGDLWILGRHRLLVGDATSIEDVDRLMDGVAADLVWTDPPYNVAVSGVAGEILNDDMSDAAFRSFLDDVFANYHRVMRPGAVIYVAHAESERANFTAAYTDAGLKLSQVRIWAKHSATLSRNDYNWQHEPILYGWREGAAHFFAGDFTLTTLIQDDLDLTKLKKPELLALLTDIRAALTSTVIHHDRPSRSELHPTMKPVGLVQEMVENSSRPGEVVLDLFGGAGSTLIAGEKTGRTCRLMELDPRFADVIVRRWEQFTGRAALLQATGQSFDEVSDGRRRAEAT